jgi:hypothetical protein
MRAPRPLLRVHGDESGVVAILVAMLIVFIMLAVGFVIDIGRLRHERHLLQAATDFGALAGAGGLPAQGSAEAAIAEAQARSVAMANDPNLNPADLRITFGCVVQDPEGNGGQDSPDIQFACGPAGGGNWPTGWRTKGTRALHDCNPYVGDKCNTIIVKASNNVPYYFAPVIGATHGNTGTVSGASCKGFCGEPAKPLDVVIVLDRTASMTPADLANAKNAALSVLGFYDSTKQYVGLVGLPYHNPATIAGDLVPGCSVNSTQNYPAPPPPDRWMLVPISNDFSSPGGGLNGTSRLVRTINCLRLPNNPTITYNGGPAPQAHTNLGDPLTQAQNMLRASRTGVPDVIIFLSDGEANHPEPSSGGANVNPCNYANTAASTAKTSYGIDIYTIGYGIVGARCTNDTTGFFNNAYATRLFASMASPTATGPSTDNLPGGCATTENNDGDFYFCESGSSDLEPVFRQIAAAALERARLIDFD